MPQLIKFPMPPSINELYANNYGSGRGRFKTKKYIQFERDCQIWSAKNWQKVQSAHHELRDHQFLKIEAKFYFPESAIITKKGTPKRLDLDNRLKALFDQMVDLLKLDDSCFFDVHCHKLVGSDLGVDILIQTMIKEQVYGSV